MSTKPGWGGAILEKQNPGWGSNSQGGQQRAVPRCAEEEGVLGGPQVGLRGPRTHHRSQLSCVGEASVRLAVGCFGTGITLAEKTTVRRPWNFPAPGPGAGAERGRGRVSPGLQGLQRTLGRAHAVVRTCPFT